MADTQHKRKRDCLTAQDAHREIWGSVARRLRDIATEDEAADRTTKPNEHTITLLKARAVDSLHEEGLLDDCQKNRLYAEHNCVLCALYSACEDCPLRMAGGASCHNDGSLYKRICDADTIDAALVMIKSLQDVDVLSGNGPNNDVFFFH